MEDDAATGVTRLLLFAEDDELSREFFCLQFNKVAPGWRIVCACEGQEAIHRLEEMDAVSAVVTDLNMPKMDGLELIEWLRTQPRYRDTPVFVLSSSEEPGQHRRCAELGIEKFMTKSGSLEILRDNIREIVRLSAESHLHSVNKQDSFA